MSVVTEQKNSANQQELGRRIWAIADDVRGAVDGWDFKQFILGTLFYRFISENMRDYFNVGEHEAGDLDFNYAVLSDDEASVDFKPGAVVEKGFFILPSQLFENVLANANDELNVTLKDIFTSIEMSAIGTDSEEAIRGLFADMDPTSNRLGETATEKSRRLLKILQGINAINFADFQTNEFDAFGYAYEYLISKYASNAGKSGGEFFTPQTVSKLLAQLVMSGKTQINKVYDPTCGSGSLLLEIQKQYGVDAVKEGYFGQEINMTNFNLARMNMFLHNVSYAKFNIRRGDTLLSPMHEDEKPFEAIVSNPPYSIKWIGDEDPTLINDKRFAPAGKLAPRSKADYAFIMHALSYLKSNGRAAIVCFPGIFYRSGAEKTIRQYLVDQNFVECLISLPDKLFFGTTIATTILILAKNKKDATTLFIDASAEFQSGTNNNFLSDENIAHIMQAFQQRESVEHLVRIVEKDEIIANDYNLSVSTYVEKKDTREPIIIEDVERELVETTHRIATLRSEIDVLVSQLKN
ncbi:MAG: type I restriction-modification system subunit M [Defluviitaleaceae bacterium]|nr:type I restriction-modification system subunit M [Defluviitaleaceae bacterium]